ncbi:MAG: hypothetical protein L6R40_005619 [Gallowayella cf. fulva]|nr:MAG: hypothetical protein L6R40_005619 [Xanthomendoza cf. fulva]
MPINIQPPALLSSPTPNPIYASPKRKRDADDPMDLSFPLSPTRLRTSDLPTCPAIPDDNLNGDRSPRSIVAGHFQNLNLTGYPFDFTRAMKKPRSPSTIADFQHSTLSTTQDPGYPSPSQPSTPDTLAMTEPALGPTIAPAKTPLEIPETPRLKPTTMLSPIPSPIPRSNSPPALNLWWADTEITGHDPKDPSDDGYGINGVGFLPTPAMASARAERRKRQVAEWKSREAREARQRRSEARRRRDLEMTNESVRASEASLGAGQQRRVRFLEV